MYLLKVSILFRSFDPLYDFKKKSGCSFWDAFVERMKQEGIDFAFEPKGSMQSVIYLPSDEDPEQWRERFRGIINEINGSADACIFSCNFLTNDEIERLKTKDIDNITGKTWFGSIKPFDRPKRDIPPLSSTPNNGKSGQSSSSGGIFDGPIVKTGSDSAEQQAQEKEEEQKPPATLAGEALRINELRRELLKRVRGQRHAVDEVVQAIFECDAFSGNDEERRGPLATFLFAGPSGVGKTFLAKCCEKPLGRKVLTVDMSEFSDNLANGKFNGDYGQNPLVTGFVREHPNGIIIFDEIEKAHINTIHLFLQILDEGRLRDMQIKQEVSFRNNIIIITTNAGHSLYEDTTVTNLSGVPRRVILDGLRKDVNPTTREQFFPDCITTRFANGHVILFNHLEPYALMEIVQDELIHQAKLFTESYGVEVECDFEKLASLVIFNSGGVADARTLRGSARQMIIKELNEVILQSYTKFGDEINDLKKICIEIDTEGAEPEVKALFTRRADTNVVVFADSFIAEQVGALEINSVHLDCFSELDAAKRSARGVVDCVLLDPAAGLREMTRIPNDIEDIRSDGMDLFRYISEYYPEVPIYLLNTRNRDQQVFGTLLAKGARGVVDYDMNSAEDMKSDIEDIVMSAAINNAAFGLARSAKVLSYNCSQYITDSETAVISFERMELSLAPAGSDELSMAKRDSQNGITFNDIIGCKSAKEALGEFIGYINNPRELISKGKRIPKGILLYGPPGTGKTMLAKAMANEAKAAFFPITATSFFGPYVGESERNIRELFARARRYAPAIIFVDEVDALARRRTGSSTSRHNEDALNAFIAEMDGFTTDERRPVFIIAATNYSISGEDGMVLDPAFVRRFDRRIFIDLPDEDARYELLKRKLANHGVNFGEAHDKILRNMARRSGGMSNADLDTIVERFLRSAKEDELTGAAFMDALDAFRFGDVNKIDPDSLRQTACHEAGHALVNRLLGKKIAFLTVVSRGNFGGYMEHDVDETKGNYTYGELMDRVCCALAGRVAEITVYGRDAGLNTGAISDIKNARYFVRTALNEYAMGDKLYTESESAECEALMRAQYERAERLIVEHRGMLDRLTDLLVKNKSLDQTQLESFFASELGE